MIDPIKYFYLLKSLTPTQGSVMAAMNSGLTDILLYLDYSRLSEHIVSKEDCV